VATETFFPDLPVVYLFDEDAALFLLSAENKDATSVFKRSVVFLVVFFSAFF
jgi:hypothetical protein